MSFITLESRPSTNGSSFTAVGNPVEYRFLRYDYFLEDSGAAIIVNSGGFAQIKIDASFGNVASFFSSGGRIYFRVYNGDYLTSSTVTSVTYDGTNTKILTTTIFTSSSGTAGYVINLSARTDYKLFLEVFRASNNESLTDGVRFSFSSAENGILNIDVSAIVKPFLSAEWENPSTTNDVEEETNLEFYIKYQQYYDGALIGSPTDDVANPIVAVFAAMQIGSLYGANLKAYVPADSSSKWLTRFQPNTTLKKLVAWRDWPFTLSFIWPDDVPLITRKVLQYDQSGALLSTTLTDLDEANINKVNRVGIGSLNASTKTLNLEIQERVEQLMIAPNLWTAIFGTGFIAPTASTDATKFYLANAVAGSVVKNAYQPLAVPNGDSISFDIQIIVVSSTLDVQFSLLDSSDTTQSNTFSVTGLTAGTTNHTVSLTATALTAKLLITTSITGTPFEASIQLLDIGEVIHAEYTSIADDLDIEVKDVCSHNSYFEDMPEKNPIHLFWKNSLGGDSFWNFDKYHEYNYVYNNGKKAKRITLFATHLHPVQWEALSELNTLSEVYSLPVVELTSTVNKTSQRADQQVYILSQDGETKTGVIVIPNSDKQLSRDITHAFAVEIELPEIFSI